MTSSSSRQVPKQSQRLIRLCIFLVGVGAVSGFHLPPVQSTSPFPSRLGSTVYYPEDGDGTNAATRVDEAHHHQHGRALHAVPASQSADPSNRQNQASDAPTSGVNMPLIRSIWYNQAAILTFATAFTALVTLAHGHNPLSEVASMVDVAATSSAAPWHEELLTSWNTALAQGFGAAIPMIMLGRAVEKSNTRDAFHVNFSTSNMVISLFGRRTNPKEPAMSNVAPTTDTTSMMALSASIALAAGISEEIVFRGYVPAILMMVTHSMPVALLGQAALFGLAHVSERSQPGENKIVGGLQLVNGLFYGLLFQVTGGNILPCIIAHVIYDMHVFCETWTGINEQMDYTQRAIHKPLSASETAKIEQIQLEAGPTLSTETLNFAKRFFYAFDYSHTGSMSLEDAQRAMSYAFLQSPTSKAHQGDYVDTTPSPDTIEQVFHQIIQARQPSSDVYTPPNHLSISEFLRLLFILKTNKYATPDSSS